MTERSIDLADKMSDIVVKLSMVSDLVKRLGDDSYLIQKDTPLGLHLIIGECITILKEIGGIV